MKNLTLAWVSRIAAGPNGVAGGGPPGGGGGGAAGPQTIVGGEIAQAVPIGGGGPRVVGAILQVNGILYMSTPDNAWAMDARDGTVLWHYYWKTKGGVHIGNRGMAMYGDWVYFELQ